MGDRLGIPGALGFFFLGVLGYMFQVFCQAMFKRVKASLGHSLRPHHPESARSRLILEAKQGRAWLVPGWETAWEYQVL